MKTNRFEAAGLECIEMIPDNLDGRDLPLVIFLHGNSGKGEKFIDLAPSLSENEYRFIFPTSQLALPGGNFQWFKADHDNPDLARSAYLARPAVKGLLDELLQKFQTPAKRVVLGGFSQGGIMTFEVGLRYPEKLAGLISLSGFLLADKPFNYLKNPPDLDTYYSLDEGDLKDVLANNVRRQTPVFIGHGLLDQAVPVITSQKAAQLFQRANVPLEYYEFPGQHEITIDELQKVKAFLQRVISK
jgi:phospholipase/carboxylesterase